MKALLIVCVLVGLAVAEYHLHDPLVAREVVRFIEGGVPEPLRSLLLYTPPFDGHVGTQALFAVAFYHRATMPGTPPICQALAAAADDTIAHMRAFKFPYPTLPPNVASPLECTLKGPLDGDPLKILRHASRLAILTVRDYS